MIEKNIIKAVICAILYSLSGNAFANPQTQTQVNINVVPVATITFIHGNTLTLDVPPSKSTVNTSGTVDFVVSGNARATLSAAPDQFIDIPGVNNGWMGKAVKGNNFIGYKLQLTFPSNGFVGSPPAIAGLPLYEPQGTPPLSAELPLTGGSRPGAIDLYASADWTQAGGLPLPGLYVGQIILTLTADNL